MLRFYIHITCLARNRRLLFNKPKLQWFFTFKSSETCVSWSDRVHQHSRSHWNIWSASLPSPCFIKEQNKSPERYSISNTSMETHHPSPRSGLKALLTQSAKTITVQPGPSRSILPGRHIKAAILNHVSRRTSNDYWAPAYFNINSLEAGIGGSAERGGVKSAAAGRILGALWLRPLCFIEAIFQCLLWQHLRLLNCGLQGKSERGREKVGGKRRERDHGSKKRGKDRWRLERQRKND